MIAAVACLIFGLGLPTSAAYLLLAVLVAPALTRRIGHKAAWVLAIVPALLFIHFASLVGTVAAGEAVTGSYRWVPSLAVDFSWVLDGLSLTVALLISGIGTFIVLYSGGYLKGHEHLGRFFSFILMFMGAMQGLVISDSFLMFFVFWELTSITSFRLIGIGASALADPADADPPDLVDPDRERQKKIEGAMDAVRRKLGDAAILKGRGFPGKR